MEITMLSALYYHFAQRIFFHFHLPGRLKISSQKNSAYADSIISMAL